MVEITKEYISMDITETFIDLITTYASSAVYGAKTYNLTTIIDSFNEKAITDKASYPIVIINDPITPTEFFSFGKTEINGMIDIDVFATSSKEARIFKDKIMYELELHKNDLADFGLHKIDIEMTDSDVNRIGSFNSHFYTITVKFTYRYNRTRAW